jgi:hypothetical protein
MKTLVLALVLLLPGCAWLRGPVVVCEIPQPPAALLAIPAPLPALPMDLPQAPK